MEGVQPLDGNAGNLARPRFQRNKLWLVTSAVQGLVLLLVLTCICLHSYAPQVQYRPIQSISVRLTRCEKGKFSLVPHLNEAKNMEVHNNSIIIRCDAFYLISLKGHFFQNVSLHLYYRKSKDPISVQSTGNKVEFTTAVYLLYKDVVYLNSQETSCEGLQVNDGELILVQQNPGGYCAP